MSAGVFTNDLRFTFVDKTAGEVGDGTAYPMEVTWDQIAEIFYRVKDAWFTGGSALWKVSGSPQTINAPTGAPTNRRLDINASTYHQRGYCKLGGDDYNGATYNAGIGSYYSDIAASEYGIWRDAWKTPHVDAFTFEQDDPDSIQGGDAYWWGVTGLGTYAKVQRGDRVAVVKSDTEDGLFAPTNKFYLEIEMYWADYGVVPFFGGTNIHDGGSGDWSAYAEPLTDCQYILRLESGDATCQVYFAAPGSTEWSGTDFIHEAKLWWPYAKDSPAVPVWNSGTGARL